MSRSGGRPKAAEGVSQSRVYMASTFLPTQLPAYLRYVHSSCLSLDLSHHKGMQTGPVVQVLDHSVPTKLENNCFGGYKRRSSTDCKVCVRRAWYSVWKLHQKEGESLKYSLHPRQKKNVLWQQCEENSREGDSYTAELLRGSCATLAAISLNNSG